MKEIKKTEELKKMITKFKEKKKIFSRSVLFSFLVHQECPKKHGFFFYLFTSVIT